MARSRKTHIHAPATSEAQPEPSDGLRAGPGSRPVSSRQRALGRRALSFDAAAKPAKV